MFCKFILINLFEFDTGSSNTGTMELTASSDSSSDSSTPIVASVLTGMAVLALLVAIITVALFLLVRKRRSKSDPQFVAKNEIPIK